MEELKAQVKKELFRTLIWVIIAVAAGIGLGIVLF